MARSRLPLRILGQTYRKLVGPGHWGLSRQANTIRAWASQQELAQIAGRQLKEATFETPSIAATSIYLLALTGTTRRGTSASIAAFSSHEARAPLPSSLNVPTQVWPPAFL